jgi:hypothetical protein
MDSAASFHVYNTWNSNRWEIELIVVCSSMCTLHDWLVLHEWLSPSIRLLWSLFLSKVCGNMQTFCSLSPSTDADISIHIEQATTAVDLVGAARCQVATTNALMPMLWTSRCHAMCPPAWASLLSGPRARSSWWPKPAASDWLHQGDSAIGNYRSLTSSVVLCVIYSVVLAKHHGCSSI